MSHFYITIFFTLLHPYSVHVCTFMCRHSVLSVSHLLVPRNCLCSAEFFHVSVNTEGLSVFCFVSMSSLFLSCSVSHGTKNKLRLILWNVVEKPCFIPAFQSVFSLCVCVCVCVSVWLRVTHGLRPKELFIIILIWIFFKSRWLFKFCRSAVAINERLLICIEANLIDTKSGGNWQLLS